MERIDVERDQAKDRAYRPPLVEAVTTKTRQSLQTKGKIQLQTLLKTVLLRVGQHAIGELFSFGGREGWHVQRLQVSIHPHLRRTIRCDMDVAPGHVHP